MKDNYSYLVVYSAAALGLPFTYDKIVEYLNEKQSKGDVIVAVGLIGTSISLTGAVALNYIGVPSNLAGYFGLAGMAATGLGVIYVAWEEGYFLKMFENLAKAIGGVGWGILKHIF